MYNFFSNFIKQSWKWDSINSGIQTVSIIWQSQIITWNFKKYITETKLTLNKIVKDNKANSILYNGSLIDNIMIKELSWNNTFHYVAYTIKIIMINRQIILKIIKIFASEIVIYKYYTFKNTKK